MNVLPDIIAILRGITPDEVEPVASALLDAGVDTIEVPLNSPDAYQSIARLVRVAGDRGLCGAGTVTSVEEVARVHAAGAGFVVSPNTSPCVIAATRDAGMMSMPGFLTPSEAFTAIAAGANALKLFPAGVFGPEYLKALVEVLPREIPVYAVGGINPANTATWLASGARGVGIGGSLYRPGRSIADIAAAAKEMVSAFAAARD